MNERSLFTHVGPRIYRIDEVLLIGYAAFLIINIVGGILALSNGWPVPAFVWAIFQWGNGLCGVLLGLRCLIIFIIYKGSPPRAELQSGIGVACGGAFFWLFLSVGAPRPEQSASPWGLTPAILLVVVSILLTIEILEKGQRAQTERRPASPHYASSPPLSSQETQHVCRI